MFNPQTLLTQQLQQLTESDGVFRLKSAYPHVSDDEAKAVFYWARGMQGEDYFKQLGKTKEETETLWKSIRTKLGIK